MSDLPTLQRRNAELRRRNAELESENERLRRRIQQLEGDHELLSVRQNHPEEAEQLTATMPTQVRETPRARLKEADLNQRDGEAPSEQMAVASQAASADPSRPAAKPASHHGNSAGGGGEESSASAAVPGWHDRQWNAMYCELEAFKAEHGHCKVPQSQGKLGTWVAGQRVLRRKERLAEERLQKLDDIGFVWGALPKWLDRLEELIKYKAQYSDCNVPASHGPLGNWVTTQRVLRRKGKLSIDRFERLDSLGFNWGVTRGPQHTLLIQWNDRYEELKEYMAEHGHSNVPDKGPLRPLGKWVVNQRQVRNKGKLSEDRIRKLDNIGFSWGKTLQAAWQDRYKELIAYKAERGHCNVSDSEEPLGSWVRLQRTNYRKGKLLEERVQKLDAIGFVWVSSRRCPTWNERLEELTNYKAMHGHCNVPRSLGTFGNWVHIQRISYKGRKLSEDRVKMLNDIGFDWRVWAPAVVNLELRR